MSSSSNDKQHVSVVIAGHVDSGKSTTTGRLLYELGGIPEREMKKLQEEADRLGKGSFAFAFYMDTQKEERARGITIACQTKQFFTPTKHYTIIDAPGHRDFIKNMITGASQADVAVLMVPADGNFVTAVQKGNHKQAQVQGQTRQHALLLNLLGVSQLIVCVNKMDEKMAGYKEERFNEIRDEIRNMLIGVGWPKMFVENRVPIIPISGYNGDNLVNKSTNMTWWDGVNVKIDKTRAVKVTTLHDALDQFVVMPPRPVDKPFRMPVSGVMNIKGIGTVITGRIEQGIIKPGQEVKFSPTHVEANPCVGKVFTIEMHHTQHDQAGPGDNIGINIKGLSKDRMPKKGDVMLMKNDNFGTVKRFTAQIQTLSIPGAMKIGYCPVGHIRTSSCAIKLVEIKQVKSKETNNEWVSGISEIKSNTTAEVVFEPTKPMCVDQFDRCEGLSRLAVMEGHGCVALGKITNVEC